MSSPGRHYHSSHNSDNEPQLLLMPSSLLTGECRGASASGSLTIKAESRGKTSPISGLTVHRSLHG